MYKRMDRHTYSPMAITAACYIVLFFLLLLLYKKLAPRPFHIQEKPSAANALAVTDIGDSLKGCGKCIYALAIYII